MEEIKVIIPVSMTPILEAYDVSKTSEQEIIYITSSSDSPRYEAGRIDKKEK